MLLDLLQIVSRVLSIANALPGLLLLAVLVGWLARAVVRLCTRAPACRSS